MLFVPKPMETANASMLNANARIKPLSFYVLYQIASVFSLKAGDFIRKSLPTGERPRN